jgi:glycosyltransferase involved in cell wall biosynthesis
MTVYPGYIDNLAQDVMIAHAAHAFGGNPRNGIIITLMDIWVLQPKELQKANVAHYMPIDHDPITPQIKQVLEEGKGLPIAFSKFGVNVLEDAGFKPLYVPHGVNTQAFKPLVNRKAAKSTLKPPNEDTFVAGMVAANQGIAPCRKAFPQVLEAWARFVRKHPNSLLYIHTDLMGIKQGVDIRTLAEQLGIPSNTLRFCDQYELVLGFNDEHMNTLYNSFDVLLSPSFGEGFGIPIIEAQSAGTPVIVNNFSAMPELCGAGWKTEGIPYYTPQKSYQVMPLPNSIADALEEAYKERNNELLRKKARTFAENYHVDLVVDKYWKPVLKKLESYVEARKSKKLVVA